MLIYGAGGHSKVVQCILSANGVRVVAIFDDHAPNVPLTRTLIRQGYDPTFMPDEDLIIAIGNNVDRRRLAGQVSHVFGNAIHPSAMVDASVGTGSGTVVAHRAVVQPGSYLGNHVIVNTGAIIDHDCFLADFVHIAPGVTLCGGVHVAECTLVGAGSIVLPGVQIGQGCIVGAGSVVTRDVPDFVKVAGNPASVIN